MTQTKKFFEINATEKLAQDARLVDGIYRWKSNDHVPFDDLLEEAGVPADVRARCKTARAADTAAFLEDYRANYKGPSDEERAEMRAAFGPGTVVMNVVTGTKVTV